MVEREAEAIRDGEQAAAERQQAEAEMENALIAQKQAGINGSPGSIAEQADGQPGHLDEGEGVITATHDGGAGNTDAMGGSTIGSPGAGTDPSETQTSGPGAMDSTTEGGVELEGEERTFEGEGRHALAEFGNSDHAIENA